MSSLSKNFSEWEFQCRCGCGIMLVQHKLIDALEKLRVVAENRPIHILSGCRCKPHNYIVGGTTLSFHLCGGPFRDEACAADIVIAGLGVRRMFRHARDVDEFRDGGIGIYIEEGFIHVDVRGEVARWCREQKSSPRYSKIPRNYY